MANFGKGRAPYPGWTASEIARLSELYRTAKWPALIEAFPGRTRQAISQMARNVLKVPRDIDRRPKWTAEEITILQRAYPTETDAELRRQLPGHSFIAIQRQASALGILRPRVEAREHRRFVLPIIKQLYQARLAQHIRRPELSRRLGYAHGQILSWELGKTMPEFRVVLEWAETLGFEIVIRPRLKELPTVVSEPSKAKLMSGRA